MTTTKERPIPFRADMIRAILAGQKTQTRRVIKPQPTYDRGLGGHWYWRTGTWRSVSFGAPTPEQFKAAMLQQNVCIDHPYPRCPYGKPGDRNWQTGMPPTNGYYYVRGFAEDKPVWLRRFLPEDYPGEDVAPGLLWGWDEYDDPEAIGVEGLSLKTIQWKRPGDRLWVREAWRISGLMYDDAPIIQYRADGAERDCDPIDGPGAWDDDKYLEWCQRQWQCMATDCAKAGIEADSDGIFHWTAETNPNRWRPSIFMPRWASRTLLEVTDVRVERVQEINGLDAYSEGITLSPEDNELFDRCPNEWPTYEYVFLDPFKTLWNELNTKRGFGWDTNPWAWVVEFKVLEP